MASTDARPIPKKGVAYRVTFPILDADGDLVTGAASLDSEVSKDAGAFADCTNEATEIATSSGMYYLDLTSTEMDADTVAVIVKTGTAGAKTTPIVLYPEEAGDIRVDVTQISGDATAADNAEAMFDNTGFNASASSIGTAAAVTMVNGLAAGVITAASIAADAIGASELAADAVAEIADAVWDEAISGHATAGTFGEQAGTDIDAILVDTADMQPKLGTPAGASISADIAAIEAQTDDIGAAGAGLTAVLDRIGTPVGASVTDDINVVQTTVDAILDDTAQIANLPALIGDIPTNAELATALGTADDAVLAAIAALNNLSAAQVLTQVNSAFTTQMADSVAADGVIATREQALYMMLQFLTDFSISGTTLTVRKVDGSTTLMSFTLNDATSPTGITRS